MKIPLKQCHLLIYDNSDNPFLTKNLIQCMEFYKGVFASMRLYKSFRRGGSVIMGMENVKFEDTKLVPIQDMYIELPQHIKTELFINIEDDTVCPPNTIMDLLKTYNKYKKKFKRDLFVTGIEPTRSADKFHKPLLAVYWLKEEKGKIIKRTTAKQNRYTTIPCHACGHYCFITTKKLWSEGWKYDRKRIEDTEHISVDVFHTYHLHKLGVPIMANFKIRCNHMHMDTRGIIYWKCSQAVPKMDYYIKEYNVWACFIPLAKEVQL